MSHTPITTPALLPLHTDAGEFGGIRGGDSALAAISNGRSEPAGANPGRQTEFFARASANATHATDRALDSNFLGDEDVDADPHNEQILTAASEGSRLQPDTRQGLDTIPDQVDDPLREEAIALAAEGGIAMGGGGGEPQERGYQQGSHHNISFPGAAAVATAQVRESDDILPVPKMHTRGELEEFRVLVETVVTTPRKLKRVYNM